MHFMHLRAAFKGASKSTSLAKGTRLGSAWRQSSCRCEPLGCSKSTTNFVSLANSEGSSCSRKAS